MLVKSSEQKPIRSESDVVLARQIVRNKAAELKFSLVEQTKLVTAVSEIARNALIYGGGGSLRVDILEDGLKWGLRLVIEDQGPGIPDLDVALKDGYTTGAGLGLGLGGAKRLVDDFEIDTSVGAGTRITMAKWRYH
jgi:serine/threonine-protein kinase RsbT